MCLLGDKDMKTKVSMLLPLPSRPQEEEDAADFVSGLASDLHHYRAEHVLTGQYLFDDWDPQLVGWAGGGAGGGGGACTVGA